MPFVRHVNTTGREASLICDVIRSRSGRTRLPFTCIKVQPTRSCEAACSFAEPCVADRLCSGSKILVNVRRSGPSNSKPSGPFSKPTETVSFSAAFEPASRDKGVAGAISQARSCLRREALVENLRTPQCLHESGSQSSSEELLVENRKALPLTKILLRLMPNTTVPAAARRWKPNVNAPCLSTAFRGVEGASASLSV